MQNKATSQFEKARDISNFGSPEQTHRRNLVNLEILRQYIESFNRRLSELYETAESATTPQPQLLPCAFKELATTTEILQVAVEWLDRQQTELAETHLGLTIQRHYYRHLFEEASEAYLLTDNAGTIAEANNAASILLNLSQKFLVGKPLSVFVELSDRDRFRDALEHLSDRDRVTEYHLQLIPRNGEPFPAMLKIATIGEELKAQASRLIGLQAIAQPRQISGAEAIAYFSCFSDRLRHCYTKGEQIPLQPQEIWFVCQGCVKLTTLTEKGKEVLMGLSTSQMLFGPSLTALSIYEAIALSDTVELITFSEEEIFSSPPLAQFLLSQLNRRLRQTESLLAVYGRRRVLDRLTYLLQVLKAELGEPINKGTRIAVRLTHQDLADACGTTRVTITKLLNQLQQQGQIRFDSHNHIILLEGNFGTTDDRQTIDPASE